jgi:outer membrane protein TolC
MKCSLHITLLRIALFISAVLGAHSARSQITLSEYRQSVYDTSPELANAVALKEQSYSAMRQERTSFLPKLSASGSVKTALRRSTAGDKFWGFAMQPSINQTIYGGGVVRAAFNQAMTGYES